MTEFFWPEIVMTGVAFLILTVYHFHFIWLARRHSLKLSLIQANRLRREWVQSVMGEQQGILPIQTMRNWVMASTFLASTAVVINIAILNVTFHTDTLPVIPQHLNLLGSKSETFWFVKLLVLSFNFFSSFFNFTLSIRYYNHAGFMINLPKKYEPNLDSDDVTEVINRGAVHYFMGMRGYYLAIPLTLWLFGPTWLLLGSLMLTVILWKLDRTV